MSTSKVLWRLFGYVLLVTLVPAALILSACRPKGGGFPIAYAILTELSPECVSSDGGTVVTIMGRYLSKTTLITITGVGTYTPDTVTPSEVTFTVGAASPGTYDLSVTGVYSTGSVTSNTVEINFSPNVDIHSVAPNPICPGEMLTILGSNFPDDYIATIAGLELEGSTLTRSSEDEIRGVVPVTTPAGDTQVVVNSRSCAIADSADITVKQCEETAPEVDVLELPIGTGRAHVAIGDITGDGSNDIAVSLTDEDAVVILANSGSGSFSEAARVSLRSGAAPGPLVVAQLDGSSGLDVATVCTGSGECALISNSGSGIASSTSPSYITTGASPSDLAVVDANGDGLMDLAVTNHGDANLTLLLQDALTGGLVEDTSSPVSVPGSSSIPSAPVCVLSALLASPNEDLVVLDSANDQCEIFLNDASSGSATLTGTTLGLGDVGESAYALLALDVSGSSDLDLIALESEAASYTILQGSSTGAFSSTVTPTLTSSTHPIAIGYGTVASGDALLVLYEEEPGYIETRTNLLASAYDLRRAFSTPGSAISLAVGELDGDGLVDAVVGKEVTGGGTTYVLVVWGSNM